MNITILKRFRILSKIRLTLGLTFALIILLLGCGKKNESVYITIENPEIKEDFRSFIEKRRTAIEEALIKHKIKPVSDQKGGNKEHRDWLQYRVTLLKNKKTEQISSSAWVWIWGTSKFLGDIDLPESIMLMFDRRDNKWVLLLEDGYLSEPRFEDEDRTGGLSPEIHADIKIIFPYHFDIAHLEELK